MFQTIVGLTGDDRSADALLGAHDMSRLLDAELTFAHACEHSVSTYGWQAPGERARAADAPLAGLRSQLIGRIRGVLAHEERLEDRVWVQAGNAAEVLSGCARVRAAGILFLGRQRRVGEAALGETQRRLLSDPPCALWFQGGRYARPKHVLLTAAGGAERDSLPIAEGLAAQLGARFDRRVHFDGDVRGDELLVLTGGPAVAAQVAELARRSLGFLVVPAATDEEPEELESVGFADPDLGIEFHLG